MKFSNLLKIYVLYFHNFRFCPSVFFYLLTSVPAIWFLELHEFDKRVAYLEHTRILSRLHNRTLSFPDLPPGVQEDLSAQIGSLLGVRKILKSIVWTFYAIIGVSTKKCHAILSKGGDTAVYSIHPSISIQVLVFCRKYRHGDIKSFFSGFFFFVMSTFQHLRCSENVLHVEIPFWFLVENLQNISFLCM